MTDQESKDVRRLLYEIYEHSECYKKHGQIKSVNWILEKAQKAINIIEKTSEESDKQAKERMMAEMRKCLSKRRKQWVLESLLNQICDALIRAGYRKVN